MPRLFTAILIIFFSDLSSAQVIPAPPQEVSLVMQESVLNNIFIAIGPVHGTSAYSFMFMEGTYDWTLLNPRIRLHPGHADFESDVRVSTGKYLYTTHVTGNVEICYEPTTNLIYVEVTEAIFPLNISFLGKVHHVWDVDLKKYFVTPFTFEGPLTTGTEFIFPMPDSTQRIIYAHPVSCGVKIDEKQFSVSAEMEFTGHSAAQKK